MSLSEHELHALLRDLESDRVERKESASDRDRLSQAVCAFAATREPSFRHPR